MAIRIPKCMAQMLKEVRYGRNISPPNFSGAYDVTVTKVEGDKVYGRYQRLGAAGGAVRADFVGTLQADKLTHSNAFSSTELTLAGTSYAEQAWTTFALPLR